MGKKNIFEQREDAEASLPSYEQQHQRLIKWLHIRKVALSNKRADSGTY